MDETGEPVEKALVQLVHSAVQAGVRRTATLGFDYTDDRGEYRFGGIPGGTYYLAVTGQPWYSQLWVFGQPDSAVSVAYAPSYYPNTLDAAHAEPISLTAGGEVRADFALRTVPGTKVTVAVEAPRQSMGTLYLARPGIGGTDEFERTLGASADKQVLQNVPPELEKTLRDHGVSTYSIFLHPSTRQLLAYVEFESEAQWNAVSRTPICRSWWAHMRELMPSNQDNSPVSEELREVFHIEKSYA